MQSFQGRLRIAVLATVLAMSSLAGTRAARAEAETSVDALWKAQRIDFEYHGGSAAYTCSGLREKIERILVRVGAREEIALSAYFCDDLTGVARLQIALESPVEATEQNVQEATAYDSHDVLVARARGETLRPAENLHRLRAVWETVSFARDRGMRLAPADCELVKQLSRQVLPRMSLRIVRNDVRCSPFGNVTPPRLTVSALVATRT
jgi:hypothetical protein